MKTRFYIASAVVISGLLLGTATAGAQLVASHVPAMPAAKTDPAGKTSTIAEAMTASGAAVARVNGTVLTERDLTREMYTIFPYAQQHNGFPKELEPDIRRGALQMIIFEELVYQEAQRREMTIPAATLAKAEAEYRKQFGAPAAYQEFLKSETNGSEAAMREKIRRSLLIEKLLKQEVTVPARVTAAQARADYLKNSAQYKHGEILRIQSISIIPPNETKAVVEEAKKRAEDAIKQAKQAKTYREFGLLAEKLSDDDFHVNMGDHKKQEASALPPPIMQALAKMKPGDVSDLIQLGNSYTIFRLEARTPSGTTPFAEVQAKLQADMQKKNTEQLRSTLAQKLRKNAKIETL
jgi:peptidyl-prolyl cis-trans isomerase SurA